MGNSGMRIVRISEIEQSYVNSSVQLLKRGLVAIDELGETRLTEKGKQKAAARLERLPEEERILLDLAFCEAHEIPSRLF